MIEPTPEEREALDRLRQAIDDSAKRCPWEHEVYPEGPSLPSPHFQYTLDCEFVARLALRQNDESTED